MNTLDVSRTLWDFALLSTVLLLVVLVVRSLLKQPALRNSLAWAATLALLALAILTAVPNEARFSLTSPAPSAPPHYLQPVVGEIIQWDMGTPPRIPERSPLPPPPLPADPAVRTIVIDWALVAMYVIAAGSLGVLCWLALGAWQVRRLRAAATPPPVEIRQLFDQLALHQGKRIQLGVLADLPVAVAVGLRRPAILLPQTLVTQANREELRSVLAHELAHIQHRDLWLLALLRGLLVLLWAHPLFWLLRSRVRIDQEILADAAAAELTSRATYAEQLVALARSAVESRVPRLASSVGLWENRTQLTERIKLLLDERFTILRSCSRRWRVGSAGMLAALAVGLSLVTLSPAETEETTEGGIAEASPAKAETSQSASEPETRDSNKLDLRKSLDSLNSQLEPNTVTGICFDENDKPLSGVAVEIFQAKEGAPHEPITIASTKSDAEGKFRFENVVDVKREFPDGLPDENFVPSGSPVYNIVARMPGRASEISNELVFQIARRGTMKLFRMPVAQSLKGRIVDVEKRPVAGARVSTGMWGEVVGIPEGVNSAITDADGRFEITDVEGYDAEQAHRDFEASQPLTFFRFAGSAMPWERFLTVEHPDFARKRAKITNIPGSVDVALSPGAVLTGQVLTQEAGKAPQTEANTEVTAMLLPAAESPSPLSYQVLSAKTDEAGNYRFESLPEGTYAVRAYLPDWVSNGVEDVNVDMGENVAAPPLIMTRGGRVRIQLVDDATGKPLTFDKPTKAYVIPVHRPLKKNIFGTRPNIVEFTRKGVGQIQVPAGNYLFNVTIPSTEGAAGWMRADFNANLSTEQIERVPGQKVDEGETRDVEVRMLREGEPQMGTFVPTSEPAEEEPTSTLIPSTPPTEVER